MTTDFKALELRVLTGEGILECKKALRLCDDDFDRALEYLLKGVGTARI